MSFKSGSWDVASMGTIEPNWLPTVTPGFWVNSCLFVTQLKILCFFVSAQCETHILTWFQYEHGWGLINLTEFCLESLFSFVFLSKDILEMRKILISVTANVKSWAVALATEPQIGGLVHLQTWGHVEIIQPTQAEIVGAAEKSSDLTHLSWPSFLPCNA